MISLRLYRIAGIVVLHLAAAASTQAAEYYDRYDLTPKAGTIDLGVQPMAYPLAFLSSVMQRDRLLRADLRKLQLELRLHPYKKGNDLVNFVGQGRLEGALLGDLPAINTIVRTPTVVVGLGKRNFSTVIARNYGRIDELRGKRIGYSPGSSSHLVLLRALRSAKMSERDVTLVPIEPAGMPDALEAGSIDAFSAWEPTPAIALSRSPRNRRIYRGMSSDWFILSREFAEKQPQAALALVAAYVRAINWMRASAANTQQATRWVLADSRRFTGETPVLTEAQATDIVRADLLDVPGAPAIPALIEGAPPLTREFAFLKEQGLIASQTSDTVIRDAFAYTGLREVQTSPKRHRTFEFDYDN